MNELQRTFEDRLSEIEEYLKLLDGIEFETQSGAPVLEQADLQSLRNNNEFYIQVFICNFTILSNRP